MLPFARKAAVCFLILSLSPTAKAADISADLKGYGDFTDKTDFSIKLSGEIRPGDAKKLADALGDTEVLKGSPIYLDLESPGGNFEEGLKIAQFMLDKLLSTRLQPNAQCLSACAVIFMAGTRFTTVGATIERLMHKTAKLGFHAPVLSVSDSDQDPEQLDEAYTAAVEGVGNKLLAIARFRGRGWNNPLIKADLVNEMMLRRGENYYLIDTVRKASSNDIEVVDAGGPLPSSESVIDACKNAYAALISDGVADNTWYGEMSPPFQRNNHALDYKIPLSRGQCIVSGSQVTVSEENGVEGKTFYGGPWIGWPGSKKLVDLPDREPEPDFPVAETPLTITEPTNCSSLWLDRNGLYHRFGYCFTGAKGIEAFGNTGCSRTQGEVWNILNEVERDFVKRVKALEVKMRC